MKVTMTLGLPEKETEREIMLKEKFRIREDYYHPVETGENLSYATLKELERRAVAPWWIIDLINEAVRHSRSCRWLDKKTSTQIRQTKLFYGKKSFLNFFEL